MYSPILFLYANLRRFPMAKFNQTNDIVKTVNILGERRQIEAQKLAAAKSQAHRANYDRLNGNGDSVAIRSND